MRRRFTTYRPGKPSGDDVLRAFWIRMRHTWLFFNRYRGWFIVDHPKRKKFPGESPD